MEDHPGMDPLNKEDWKILEALQRILQVCKYFLSLIVY
jgi:hypothetical protein